MKIYCYPKCTTCKKALKWLDEQGKAYEEIDIKENNPSQWKKIVEAVDDFVQNPKNKAKLKAVAEVAGQNFPNNTRNFSTTLKALGG